MTRGLRWRRKRSTAHAHRDVPPNAVERATVREVRHVLPPYLVTYITGAWAPRAIDAGCDGGISARDTTQRLCIATLRAVLTRLVDRSPITRPSGLVICRKIAGGRHRRSHSQWGAVPNQLRQVLVRALTSRKGSPGPCGRLDRVRAFVSVRGDSPVRGCASAAANAAICGGVHNSLLPAD